MRTHNRLPCAAVALTAVLAVPGIALAQSNRSDAPDFTLAPIFGSVTLESGFVPDPHRVQLTSGGRYPAAQVQSGCVGNVSRAPDYQLHYTAGALSLHFRVDSDKDTTLLINGPDGRWRCDDDSGQDLNPLVTYERPANGRYDIWVGDYLTGVDGSPATLSITELAQHAYPVAAENELDNFDTGEHWAEGTVDWTLQPNYGQVTLRAGFRSDPHRVDLLSGGGAMAASVKSECPGYVSTSPDYRVLYTAGQQSLTFRAEGNGDTMLLVRRPDGSWVCDDDSGGALNPKITLRRPGSGQYDIWVGDFRGPNSDAAPVSVSLVVTERD